MEQRRRRLPHLGRPGLGVGPERGFLAGECGAARRAQAGTVGCGSAGRDAAIADIAIDGAAIVGGAIVGGTASQ